MRSTREKNAQDINMVNGLEKSWGCTCTISTGNFLIEKTRNYMKETKCFKWPESDTRTEYFGPKEENYKQVTLFTHSMVIYKSSRGSIHNMEKFFVETEKDKRDTQKHPRSWFIAI
jgi:hypothetical protein